MEKDKYRLGLVSVSFRQHTPEEILEAMHAAGLACIEWGSDVHAPCHDTARLYEIAQLQEQYGIVCSSYGTYFRLGQTPMDELESYIAAAKVLGTDILRLWCGTKSGKQYSDSEKQELMHQCKKAAQISQNAGVTLCMECHKDTLTESPDDAVLLMKTVDSPHFCMYWQPFQWQSSGQNIENAKKIAAYAKHIHVFNWKGKEKLPLADAVAEWKSYLQALSVPRTLLLEFMPNGTIGELEREAAALKTIVGELI